MRRFNLGLISACAFRQMLKMQSYTKPEKMKKYILKGTKTENRACTQLRPKLHQDEKKNYLNQGINGLCLK